MEIMKKPIRPETPKRVTYTQYFPNTENQSSLEEVLSWADSNNFDHKNVVITLKYIGYEDCELDIYHEVEESEEDFKKKMLKFEKDFDKYSKDIVIYDAWYKENKKEIIEEIKKRKAEEKRLAEIERLEKRLKELKKEGK